jgi:hypothetical protein
VFASLGDPVYNNNDAVAFRATPRGGDTVASGARRNSSGIWANNSGLLQLVARQGGIAPNASGAVFLSFLQIALPDQGGVVMFASLSGRGITSTDNQGIWAVDTSGTLRLISLKGTVHAVTGKIITGLPFLPAVPYISGQTRSFDQGTGDILYKATFKDGSSGIYRVIFE